MSESLQALCRDRSGVTIVEFALISGPLLMVTLGGLDLAYQGYLSSVVKSAIDDASRRATVESPNIPGTGALRDRIKVLVSDQIHDVAPRATVDVITTTYDSFSSIKKPEKLTSDTNGNGQYDPFDGDCFQDANGNGSYDTDRGRSDSTGYANDVVLYSAKVKAKRLFPLAKLIGLGGSFEITATTAVRNQPYDTQKTPRTICGH